MLVLIIDSRWNQEIYRGVQFGQVFASKHFSLFVTDNKCINRFILSVPATCPFG